GEASWEASARALTPAERGLGASEQRSARRARAAHGPPGVGGRARGRSRRPTGSGGIGAAQRPQGASTARAPRRGRPSARALTVGDGGGGHRREAAAGGR